MGHYLRALVLDWHDGPQSGIVACTQDGKSFWFEAVAIGRVASTYCFWPLPDGSLERCVELLYTFEPPSWPVWVPRWEFSSSTAAENINGVIDEMTRRRAPVQWVKISRSFVDAGRSVELTTTEQARAVEMLIEQQASFRSWKRAFEQQFCP